MTDAKATPANASPANASRKHNHLTAIASLAKRLKVPEQQIVAIYEQEFDRLAAQARIPTFLGVLALRNTRSILRRHGGVAQAR